MVDPFAKEPSKKEKFLKILKVIFLKRFPMNLLFLIIIIALTIFGFQYIEPDETPTGGVIGISEPECPECVCEEKECEQDCDLCPIKTKLETKEVIRYQCPDGELADELEECEKEFPDIDEEYSGTIGGVTLAIDNIEYERDEEDSGFVTRVDYTIINKGEFPIVPKIEVKVYEDWSLKTKTAPANKVIDPEIVINTNDYVQREDRVRIYFNGEEQTLRLLLIDALTDPDTEFLAVTRDFSLD